MNTETTQALQILREVWLCSYLTVDREKAMNKIDAILDDYNQGGCRE